jgi:hypothetical protein
MAGLWKRIERLMNEGVPEEFALYLLPNAVSIRFEESGDLLNFHHKWTKRLVLHGPGRNLENQPRRSPSSPTGRAPGGALSGRPRANSARSPPPARFARKGIGFAGWWCGRKKWKTMHESFEGWREFAWGEGGREMRESMSGGLSNSLNKGMKGHGHINRCRRPVGR